MLDSVTQRVLDPGSVRRMEKLLMYHRLVEIREVGDMQLQVERLCPVEDLTSLVAAVEARVSKTLPIPNWELVRALMESQQPVGVVAVAGFAPAVEMEPPYFAATSSSDAGWAE